MSRTIPSILFILLLLISGSLFAQDEEASIKNKRLTSDPEMVYQSSQVLKRNSLRIDNGKVWINGNLVPADDLPESFCNFPPSYHMEISFSGSNEFKFNLNGKPYLLKNNRIIELENNPQVPPPAASGLSKEGYFNEIKNESPKLFYRLNREAQLHEECLNLMLDYQVASDDQKPVLREDLKKHLEELFDISYRNQLDEVQLMETDLDAIKKELEFRKKNKDIIVQNRLNELIQD